MSQSTDKLRELREEHERADLSHIEEGDTVVVKYKEFIGDQYEPFQDLEDEMKEASFTVERITHPSGSAVGTYLWSAPAGKPNSAPDAICIDDLHTVEFGSHIEGFWFEISAE